jgi:hypothetical protein
MKRRDFLLFRRTRHARIIEIPCERIYMNYVDASVAAPRPPDEPRDGSLPGEPAAELAGPAPKEALETLSPQLQDVDVVRVIDRHWLAADDLNREFDTFLAAFIARGGRVEFVDGTDEST